MIGKALFDEFSCPRTNTWEIAVHLTAANDVFGGDKFYENFPT